MLGLVLTGTLSVGQKPAVFIYSCPFLGNLAVIIQARFSSHGSMITAKIAR